MDGDQMLFAFGAANQAVGLTGSLVTGNSPSCSATMDASGAKSQLPSLVAAGTIAVVLLFPSDLLAFLPNAALAGIAANAVRSLIEVHEFRTDQTYAAAFRAEAANASAPERGENR